MIREYRRMDERGLTRPIRERLNELAREIRSLRIASGLGYSVKRTSTGQILDIQAGRAATSAALEVRRFQVTAVRDTYLECGKTNDDLTAITGSVNVLRPRATWPTDSDSYPAGLGVTLNTQNSATSRTLTIENNNLTYELDQQIHPAYTPGTIPVGSYSIIYALKDPKGGIGQDDAGGEITWIDLNVDARHWAWVPQLTEVCVNDETKTLYLPRSDVEA